MFRVMEIGDGVELSGPNGNINVFLDETEEEGQIHVGGLGDGVDGAHLPITGDTYNKKERIKDVGYGYDGVEWNGDVWVVHKEAVTELVSVLLIAGCDVTVSEDAVANDGDWGILQEEVEADEDEECEYKVMVGPKNGCGPVSQSWAEDAAELANFSSVAEFSEKYGIEVLSDEEIMDRFELDEDHPDVVEASSCRE